MSAVADRADVLSDRVGALFAGGRIVDLILLLVVAEALALVVLHRVTRRGVAPGKLLANLLAGGFLLLAVRSGLVGAGWPVMAGWLGLSLLAHLADLRARWQDG